MRRRMAPRASPEGPGGRVGGRDSSDNLSRTADRGLWGILSGLAGDIEEPVIALLHLLHEERQSGNLLLVLLLAGVRGIDLLLQAGDKAFQRGDICRDRGCHSCVMLPCHFV